VGSAITASPDGQRVYVGGSFTQVNGQTRNRIAALTPAGDLVAGWAPNVNAKVAAIAATNSTVYFGGSFSAVGSTGRQKLAAVSASTGALTTWAPVPGIGPTDGNRDGQTATTNNVKAMVVAGPNNQVVAAGHFYTMNGTLATGVAAIDGTTGANRPFAINQLITNQGVNSAIMSLSTDGTNVYGSGYDFFGPGNVEGSFAATADGGQIVEINDCRGDTYSTFPMNGVLYTASHSHNCNTIGGVLEQTPRVEKRAHAYTTTATTRVRPGGERTYANWVGQPAGAQLAFYPDVSAGTFTGQNQGGWSVTGNGQYLSFGGEFPRVNNTAQQGLVRFAMPNVTGNPNRRGPIATNFAATVEFSAPGVARVSWNETWDYDNEFITYRLYRDSDAAAPIFTATRPSRWYEMERMGFSDFGQSGSHRYRVTATDPFGNAVATPWVTVDVTAGSTQPRSYVDVIRIDGAIDHWPMSETSGVGYSDMSGNDLTVGSGVTRGQSGAIVGDSNTAFNFNGSSTSATGAQRRIQGSNVFTLEAWFRTTSTSGGKILGFGSALTGTSGTYDRHIYMDGAGRVFFGVNYLNERRTLQSSTGFNNGVYHHVAATLGPNGMELYLDGVRVGQRTDTTFGPNYFGYWRIGGDATWAGAQYFNGRIDEVAIYQKVLSPARIAAHRAIGLGASPADFPIDEEEPTTTTSTTTTSTTSTTSTTTTSTTTTSTTSTTTTTTTLPPDGPVAAFSNVVTDLSVEFDGSASTGNIVDHAWDFGDGGTGNGATTSHIYEAPGSYTVSLTVTDDEAATNSTSAVVSVGTPPVIASDGFERTVASGLGTADIGGAWTATNSVTLQSVSAGAAQLRLPSPNSATAASLNSVSTTSANMLTSFSLNTMPTGSGTYLYFVGRRIGLSELRVRVRMYADGRIALGSNVVNNNSSGAITDVIVPGLTYTAGTVMNLRLVVTGTSPTTMTAKIWPAGGTEPAADQLSVTNTTASLQGAGAVGVLARLPGDTTSAITVSIPDFVVTAG
jgi:PKD repeat protein